jgi:glycosyltransferase involved in cell wall biosynthesis
MVRRFLRWLVLQAVSILYPIVTTVAAWLRDNFRCREARKPRLLFIDQWLPLRWYGAGFSRANAMLRLIAESGWRVTCYPIMEDAQPASVIRADIPSSVEVVAARGGARLKLFLLAYDLILISRSPSLECVGDALKWVKATNSQCKIIFDFEALPPFGIRSRQVLGKGATRAEIEALLRAQIADISWIDAVVCNSAGDARELQQFGRQDAVAINYLDITAPTPADFSEREHLLFVGRLAEEDSPNVDGLAWFIREVWPIIVARLGAKVRLLVAGLTTAPSILAIKSESIQLLGVVTDLHDLYNRTRLFVAANRVSFGVPIKVLEAAAHGVPVVTTDEVNWYLNWDNGSEILCADASAALADACIRLHEDPVLWRRIRDRALARVDAEGNRRRLLDLVEQLAPQVR